jgi:DNA-directed RNA polymerase specialized sigma24 family protein
MPSPSDQVTLEAGAASALLSRLDAQGNAQRARARRAVGFAFFHLTGEALLDKKSIVEALNGLSYRERRVMELLDGKHERPAMSHEEVAEFFGISCQEVHLLERAAQNKLSAGLRPSNVAPKDRRACRDKSLGKGGGRQSL